jgi:hypothetical protein
MIIENSDHFKTMKVYINIKKCFIQDLKKADVTLKTERDQWKDQALANKNEIERLRGKLMDTDVMMYIL